MAGFGAGFGSGFGGSLLAGFTIGEDGVPIEIPPGELDCEATAQAMVWKQFEGTNWVDMMAVVGGSLAPVNAQQYDIWHWRRLDTAFGDTLDEVGARFGLERGSLSDDGQYRLAIRAEAASLFSSGTRPQILQLARALFPFAPPIEFLEFYPGSWDLRIRDITGADLDLLERILEDVPCAGVRGFVSTYTTGEAGGDDWDSGTDPALLGYDGWEAGDAPGERSYWIHERAIGS